MTDRASKGVPAGTSGNLGQVKSLIRMLRHDMEGVAECRCKTHGGTGAGLNFTITLLCLVACEVAGVLRYGNPKAPGPATGRFLGADVAAAASAASSVRCDRSERREVTAGVVTSLRSRQNPARKWRARQDSNLRPSA